MIWLINFDIQSDWTITMTIFLGMVMRNGETHNDLHLFFQSCVKNMLSMAHTSTTVLSVWMENSGRQNPSSLTKKVSIFKWKSTLKVTDPLEDEEDVFRFTKTHNKVLSKLQYTVSFLKRNLKKKKKFWRSAKFPRNSFAKMSSRKN